MSQKGGFTLPGEAGYEKLTLDLAKKWGADVIRDSDGTVLSDEITSSGYGIYSTICIIRDHNEWARNHMSNLQQTFLCTEPIMAPLEGPLCIPLLNGFYADQFAVNDSEEGMQFMQVWDRTENKLLSSEVYNYEKEAGVVVIQWAYPYHEFTVSFLAYRIWEEISMYNHVTNSWDKEHLMPIDPRQAEAKEYLYKWMDDWCKSHPATTVVRFTSMFYNFVWIWGSDERNRYLYSDWGSYDFTVSPKALKDFEREYGYSLTAEDFINQGKRHVTHMQTKKKQLDYMEFTNKYVVNTGKKLVDIVHKYGKKAYVFYDDSWVGVEPYSKYFKEFGFDGLIKCVFSGYEARLCAGADVDTHELRLHPYLFPVGLGGAPTFMEGGNPTLDAKQYWNRVRRALLREPIERIGLGGYLHLVQDYPDFCDYIETVADEFREIGKLHEAGEVYTLSIKDGVLHCWGSLRPWTLSGHFHETYMHDLIHINEALAGLPVDVRFISFEDVKNGILSDFDVIINAGRAGSAWSGGDNWKSVAVVGRLQEFVYNGGCFIGVNEPSAVEGFYDYFRMGRVLGIDYDNGDKVCHGKWQFEVDTHLKDMLMVNGADVPAKTNLFLTDQSTKVLMEKDGFPVVTCHDYGKGKGIYLSGFELSNANTRMLLNLLIYGTNNDLYGEYITDCADAECAYYPSSGKLVVMNDSNRELDTSIRTSDGIREFHLKPYETFISE